MTEVESLVIDALSTSLPSSLAKIINRQRQCISKIQRRDRGREVDFYYLDDIREIPRFIFNEGNEVFELARLKLVSLDSGHQAHVSVQLGSGRLASLLFNAPPGDLRGERLDINIKINVSFA